jgi:peptide/nickel transport system permease protein
MRLRYYVILRALMVVPTLIILLSTVFFIMHILPGDPVRIMFGEKMPEETIQEIRNQLGLDRPLFEQYLTYITKFFRGDFGISWLFKMPVIDMIREVYPTTIELTLGALLFGVIIGIPLGILSAMKRGKKTDNIITVVALYLYSNPSFWLALLLQLLFCMRLGILPLSGRSAVTSNLPRVTGLLILDSILALDFNALIENLRYLILPCLTLGLGMMPMKLRITRAAMLNELGEDYVTTARAKGLPEWMVYYRHAFRNALLPIITTVGASLTALLGGTVIIEKVFSLPGLGRLLLDALQGRDFEMIQGIVGIYILVVVVINTAVDLIYAKADPRVKF